MTLAPLRPAATLIIMRDRDGAPPELLMLQRAAGMAFAGGAWVFPGGRVDAGDEAPAVGVDPVGHDGEDLAARIAAIRETIEEAGIAVGLDPLPDRAGLRAIRAGLADERPLGGLLAEAGCRIDPDALVPFARWIPPHAAPRRFDTRFYLAKAPADAPISADGGESVAIRWMSADEALAEAEAGEIAIILPTRANLMRLAPYRSFAEASAAAAEVPVRPLLTYQDDRDGVPHVCVPAGFGYPPISVPLDRLLRG